MSIGYAMTLSHPPGPKVCCTNGEEYPRKRISVAARVMIAKKTEKCLNGDSIILYEYTMTTTAEKNVITAPIECTATLRFSGENVASEVPTPIITKANMGPLFPVFRKRR